MELPHLALERLLEIAWPVACGEPPDIRGIAGPAHWIRCAPCAVGVSRAPAVLEIVKTRLAHHRILDPAEIDPDVAVLMPEQRREADVPRRPLASPEFRIARRPLLPQV